MALPASFGDIVHKHVYRNNNDMQDYNGMIQVSPERIECSYNKSLPTSSLVYLHRTPFQKQPSFHAVFLQYLDAVL